MRHSSQSRFMWLSLCERLLAMKEEHYFEDVQKALENLPDNFSVLEEQIDVKIQQEYFEKSRALRDEFASPEDFEEATQEALTQCNRLYDQELAVEQQKRQLCLIAACDDVRAYRFLEKYLESVSETLRPWAVLSLQESRMLMHTSLLGEKQVFISTGLGGKGKKIRYFAVFVSADGTELTPTQQKLLKDELVFELKKHDGEFESMDFAEGISSALVLLPVKTDIRQVFSNVIDECNQYGNFLRSDIIVTNVKMLSLSEIQSLLAHSSEDVEDNPFDDEDIPF